MKLKLITLVSLVALLSACSNKDDGSGRLNRYSANGIVNNNPNDGVNCDNGICGTIYGNSQSTFQNAWYEFFSTDSSTLGTLSSRAGDTTGVRFFGSIPTSAAIACGSSNSASIQYSSAHLSLLFFDSYATSGQESAIRMDFAGAVNGRISGQTFEIVFDDQYGSVILDGTIGATTTQGYMNFENYEGDLAIAGPRDVLLFSIPSHALFSCR